MIVITISSDFLLGFVLILFGFLIGLVVGYCFFTIKD